MTIVNKDIKIYVMKNLRLIIIFCLISGLVNKIEAKTTYSKYYEVQVVKQLFNTMACDVPTNLTSTNITSSTATLGCDPVSTATSYDFAYKVNGGNWITENSLTNSLNIVGLTPSSIYQYKVKAKCPSGTSAYSANATFTTNSNSCLVPTNPTTTAITSTTATFNWTAVSGAIAYHVEYRVKLSSGLWDNWQSVSPNPTINSYVATGLIANSDYQWRVKTICNGGESDFILPFISFSTQSNCAVPTGLTSSNVTTTSVQINWTASNGALSYQVEYKNNGNTNWTIFSPNPIANTVGLTGLTPGTIYSYRVKTICSGTESAYSATPNPTFQTNPLNCSEPINLYASNVSTNSAILNWNAVIGASAYIVDYKIVGTASWTTVTPNTTTNLLLLNGLASSESYTFRVKTICGSMESGYSATPNPTFQTQSLTCNAPTGMSTTAITTTGATFNWNVNPLAISYKVQFREKESNSSWGPWQEFSAGLNFYNMLSLTPNSPYQWQVKSVCSPTLESNWSTPITSFTTNQVLCELPTGLNTLSITASSANLVWDNAGGASSYFVQYRAKNVNNTWGAWLDITPNPTINSVVLSGLIGSNDYQWRLKSICGAGYESAFTLPAIFTTLSGCFPPLQSSLNTTSISSYSATLNWKRSANPPVLAYVFCYKKVTNPDWNCDSIANISGNDTIIIVADPNYNDSLGNGGSNLKGPLPNGNNTNISVKLNGLMHSTDYVWKVKSICVGGGASDFSSPNIAFTTDPICKEPKNLDVSNLGTNKVTLQWNPGGGDVGLYVVKYKLATANNWITKYAVNDSTKLTNLLPGTTYVFKVQAKCSAPDTSAFSPIFSFTTLTPCNFNPPTNLTSTLITSTTAKVSWSAVNGASSYELWYKPNSSSTWIKELNITTTFKNLSGLLPGTTYRWRVKNNCQTDQSEFTDTLTNFKTRDECVIPNNITGVSNAIGAATISWTMTNVGINYKVRYRLAGTSDWTTTTISGNAMDINFLTPGATYEYQVQTICLSPDTSLWSTMANFVVKTPCTLVPLTGLIANNITQNSAKLEWTSISQATQYQVNVRKETDNLFLIYYVNTNGYQAFNLESETKYFWKVKPICPSGESDFSNQSSFTTIGCRLPTGISAYSNVIGGASITWDQVPGAVSYNVKYRKLSPPAGNWISANVSGNVLNLTGLGEGKKYEYSVQTICLAPDTSSWSVEKEFITKDDCTISTPNALYETNISASTAILHWTSTGWSPIKWTIQVKKGENGDYFYYDLPSAVFPIQLQISNLESGTDYYWRVKTICSTGESDLSVQSKFTTGGCGIPQMFRLESNSVNAVTLTWEAVPNAIDYRIEYLPIAGDGVPGNGLTHNIGFPSTAYIESGLVQNTKYKFRIQASCSTINGGYGDFTEYKEVWTRNENCNLYPPTDLYSSDKTSTSFRANWNGSNGSVFEVRFRVDPDDGGNGDWTIIYSYSSFCDIFNLLPGKKYNWGVRSLCLNVEMPPSQWSINQGVILPNGFGGEGGNCRNGVDGLIVLKDPKNPNEALVYWSIVGRPTTYYIKYKEIKRDGTFGIALNTSLPGDQHSITLKNLIPSEIGKPSNYNVEVTADCGSDGLSASTAINFQTELTSKNTPIGKQISTNITNVSIQKIEIFPNPSRGIFKLKCKTTISGTCKIRIYDITGNTVKEDEFESEIGTNEKEFNLLGISKGLYFVEITNGLERFSGKLVIIQ